MRNRVIWLTVLLLVGFIGLSPSHAQVGVNELTNGGFEEGPSMPLNTWAPGTWNVYGSHTVQVVSELRGAAVPEAPVEGRYCLHVTVPAAGANFWDAGLLHIGHTFKRGKKYTLSVFLKCKSGTLRVNLKPELGKDPLTGYGEGQVIMTDKWAEYSTTTPVFTADVTPGILAFHIAFAAGDFWVDGVRWYEGDYVPPSSPLSGIPTNLGSTVNSAYSETAPPFTLTDLNGKQVSLSDFKGKVILLDFWATWCPPCRQVIPHLEALHKKYKDQGLVIIGMNHERDQDTVKAFVKEQMSYIVLLNADEQFKEYGIRSIPTAFYIDREGKIRHREVGYSPGTERQVEQRVNELLTTKEVMAGGRAEYPFASSSAPSDGALGEPSSTELDRLIDQLKHNDSRTRAKAASALDRLGDKRAFEPLIAALKDNDAGVRQAAAWAVATLGDKLAVEPLITVLKDNDAGVRQAAASALGGLGDKRAVEPLIAALKDNDAGVRHSAVLALHILGDKRAVEPLIAALKDNDRSVRLLVPTVLGWLGDKRAFEPLIAGLKDEDAEVRRRSARALGPLGDPRAFEPLISVLKDENASVRSFAAEGLGELGDKRAVEPLIAMLKDAEVRRSVAWALGQLGDERAIEPLREALRDDDGNFSPDVAFALARLLGDERAVEPLLMATEHVGDFGELAVLGMLTGIGPPAVEPLIAALKHENKHVRYIAFEVLVDLDDQRAVKPVIAFLKSESAALRKPDAKALKTTGSSMVEYLIELLEHKDKVEYLIKLLKPKDTVEYLIELLKHREREMSLMRSSSAWALGWLGDKRAVEPLGEALGEARGDFREAAVALSRLGDKRALEPLIRDLKRLAPDKEVDAILGGMAQEMAQSRRPLVVKVLDALVKIGPPAVEPLIDVLKDENPHVRSFAAEGLGEMGDKRAVQPLVTLLKDEDEEVRQSATKALSKLGWQPGRELQ